MHDMATKALYNNILLYGAHEARVSKSSERDDWKSCNWRARRIEDLFEELDRLGVHFDRRQFLSWASESDSPEDLLSLIMPDEYETLSSDTVDHVYLIIFELWRRLIPERRPLSIVADDIDHAIVEYDKREDDDIGPVQVLTKLLFEYIRILQSAQDQLDEQDSEERKALLMKGYTTQAHALFGMTEPYFVHEIGRFIFDFVIEELTYETLYDFSPIVEGIHPFLVPVLWADSMLAHLVWYTDETRAIELNREIAKKVIALSSKESVIDTSLFFSALLLAAKAGDRETFFSMMRAFIKKSDHLAFNFLFELLSLAALYLETVHHPDLQEANRLIQEVENDYERYSSLDNRGSHSQKRSFSDLKEKITRFLSRIDR